ncbi:MAG: cell shape-determining protein MreC [Thermonema sp.]|uniref:rod shape-determining protein MreC n=1 Tax=Thermonema sp. TaxID=2231181 RepID=UPI0021DE5075|nr:rod shape-determining protein MreC [Thermonema sp.]GIV38216.1 MAG: cell shape-determining protein MreC [Thermonema sp.]
MQALFAFLYRIRVFLLFLLLEAIAIVWMSQGNSYHSYVLRQWAREFSGFVQTQVAGVYAYFHLREDHQVLLQENSRLRQDLWHAYAQLNHLKALRHTPADSLLRDRYELVDAQVVGNQTHLSNNYFLINKGSQAGIAPGMGVIGPQGVAGKVVKCSPHYSVVLSLLSTNFGVSAYLPRLGHESYVRWDGKNARYAALKDVPKPVKVVRGDSVFTSNFSRLFPEGLLIGIVTEVKDIPGSTYRDVMVKLSTDFRQLRYVYVLKETDKEEIDSLTEGINF